MRVYFPTLACLGALEAPLSAKLLFVNGWGQRGGWVSFRSLGRSSRVLPAQWRLSGRVAVPTGLTTGPGSRAFGDAVESLWGSIVACCSVAQRLKCSEMGGGLCAPPLPPTRVTRHLADAPRIVEAKGGSNKNPQL